MNNIYLRALINSLVTIIYAGLFLGILYIIYKLVIVFYNNPGNVFLIFVGVIIFMIIYFANLLVCKGAINE